MRLKAVGNMLTECCTLRCKNCNASMPYIPNPVTFDTDILKLSIAKIFECFEFIDEFGFYGGEALLHPDLAELIAFAAQYRAQFGFLRLMTNATIVPTEETLDALKPLEQQYDIQVDDYGKSSRKLRETLDLLDRHKMNVRLVHYNESEQYCGGWVDFGVNYDFKNYSEAELQSVFDNCHSKDRCYVNWGGELHRCAFHAAGVRRGLVPKVDGDSVDLLHNDAEEIRRQVALLETRIVEGCKYCNGFDIENGKRVRAGEQLER